MSKRPYTKLAIAAAAVQGDLTTGTCYTLVTRNRSLLGLSSEGTIFLPTEFRGKGWRQLKKKRRRRRWW